MFILMFSFAQFDNCNATILNMMWYVLNLLPTSLVFDGLSLPDSLTYHTNLTWPNYSFAVSPPSFLITFLTVMMSSYCS
jgi:hypothetical protein